MKKFKGNRHINDIKFFVKRAGGQWDSSAYDNNGSDWQFFQFFPKAGFPGMPENTFATVMYSSFNGRFMIREEWLENNNIITESSDNLDGVAWYDELLDLLYEPAEEKAAA